MGAAVQVDPGREEAELREYLGDRFDHRRLVEYDLEVEREFSRVGDEDAFYRSSEAYLYNLTAFAMTGTKVPYLRDLQRLVAPGASLLDFGCGIGSDGLALIEAGYRVVFADFDNPSTRYLRWRLERRGLSASIYDLDRSSPPGGFDLAYALDVIEHVQEPVALLETMERQADTVLVNLLEPNPFDTVLHHPLPLRAITKRARDRGLVHYRRYHGRSHLLAYGGATGSSRSVLGARARLALTRLPADPG